LGETNAAKIRNAATKINEIAW